MRRLTDVNYWEQSRWKGERPRKLTLHRDFDFETVRLLRESGGRGPARVLEIGAGGSLVLPYLAYQFGYAVFGSDFSLSGCRLLRANLALRETEGSVVCEDLFSSSLLPATFDLVYSSGLIEHFDDLEAVICEHLKLLKPGGRVVLIVPNLQGIEGRIIKRLAPPLWDRHRVFGPQDLAGTLERLGVLEVRSGYLGSFLLRIGHDAEWSALANWPAALRRILHGSVRVANAAVSLFFRLSPIRPHGRTFSPAFYASGEKPAG